MIPSGPIREHSGGCREMLSCRVGRARRHSSWLISTSSTAISEAALLVSWTTHVEFASGKNKSSHINCHVHSTLYCVFLFYYVNRFFRYIQRSVIEHYYYCYPLCEYCLNIRYIYDVKLQFIFIMFKSMEVYVFVITRKFSWRSSRILKMRQS